MAEESQPSPTTMDLFWSTIAIVCLGMAEPVLDLLGDNPTFFTARGAPRSDVILLPVMLALLIPLAVAAVVVAAHLAHRTAGLAAHTVTFVSGSALLVLALLRRSGVTALPGWVAVAGSFAIALGGGVLYHRAQMVRTMFRYLAIAPVVVVSSFLFVDPAARLAWPPGAVLQPIATRIGNPAPVVMIVFDEFPVTSIMDAGGRIAEDQFPGFSRLAQNATWFRNAAGNRQGTEHAIPTILTGVAAPLEGRIPVAADYPENLFTLVGDSYEVSAVETLTELCPSYICHQTRNPPDFVSRWEALLRDIGVVYGHVIIPPNLTVHLPSIDEAWGNFVSPELTRPSDWNIRSRMESNVEGDRRTEVARLLELVDRPLREGRLVFAHLLLPHSGWNFLPDGRRNVTATAPPARDGSRWKSDPWLVAQAYQSHLVQVQYVDSIVGDVISRLETHGSYDETLLIVLADHGISFQPGTLRRSVSENNVAALASVPLFVKLPHQSEGTIDDFRAETPDVLPTIADVLDVEVPWTTDGMSLLAADRPSRGPTIMEGPHRSASLDADGEEKFDIVRYYERYFGERGPFGLAPEGYAGLLDQDITLLTIQEEPGLRISIDGADVYRTLDDRDDSLPALITGSIGGEAASESVLAVALNGRIVAVTRTWVHGEQSRFQALLPPSAFADRNDVRVFKVAGPASQQVLMLPGHG